MEYKEFVTRGGIQTRYNRPVPSVRSALLFQKNEHWNALSALDHKGWRKAFKEVLSRKRGDEEE